MTVINEQILKEIAFIFLNKYIDSLGKNVAIFNTFLKVKSVNLFSLNDI